MARPFPPFLAQILALIVTGCLGVPWAAGETPLDRFDGVQRVRDLGEINRAQTLSAEAVEVFPASFALWAQRGELLLAREGPAGLRALLDAAPAQLPAEVMAIHLASAEQRLGRTDSLLMALSLEDESFDALIRDLYLAQNARRPGASRGAAAESILARARGHPLLREETSHGLRHVRGSLDMVKALSLDARGERVQALEALQGAREWAMAEGLRLLAMRIDFRLAVLTESARERVPRWMVVMQLATQLGEMHREALARNYLAYAHSQLGDLDASLEQGALAYESFRRTSDVAGLAWNRLTQGWDLWRRGRVTKAEIALQESRVSFEFLDQAYGRGLALNNLGVIFTETERLDEAVEIYEAALMHAEEVGNERLESWILNNIAGVHRKAGRHHEAALLYQRSLELARARGDVTDVVSYLGNLALVSFDLGRLEQAWSFFDEAVAACRRDGRAVPPNTRQNYAMALLSVGRVEEAAVQLALAIRSDPDNPPARASLKFQIARLHHYQGHHREAWQEILEAEALHEELGASIHLLNVLIVKASTLRAIGSPREALEVVNELEDLALRMHQPYHLTMAHNLRSTILHELGDTQAAIQENRTALASLLSTREEVASSDVVEEVGLKAQRLVPGYRAFDTFVQIHELSNAATNATELVEAFEMLQQLKARSLLDRLQRGEQFLRPHISPELEEEEREMKLRITRLRQGLSASPSDSLRLELVASESAYHEIRDRIVRSDERYDRASRRRALGIEEIRGQLLAQPGTLLLDYYVGEDSNPVLLFVLDESGLDIYPLDPAKRLREQVEFYLALIESPPIEGDDELAVQAVAESLFDSLLAPVRDRLQHSEHLVIAGDAFLHRLPFGALLDSGQDSSPGSRYLVEKIAICSPPSLSILADLIKARQVGARVPRDHGLRIWSGENSQLRYAGTEAEELLKNFGGSEALNPGVEAGQDLRGLLRSQLMGQSRVLHFIAHGVFEDRRPWASGLVLKQTPEGKELDRLEVTDVYHLDFSSDLVTLSACETARFQTLEGEGMQSFAHALFGSGAVSVLASLWRVDDASTPMFMQTFYSALAEGVGKSQALAEAQRSFLADPQLRHPFYWASFVMLGEGTGVIPLEFRRETRLETTLLLLMAALLLGVAQWLRRSTTSRSKA